MERRLAVHARAYRQALTRALTASLLLASVAPATAAPKTAPAKAAFDRGVAAYARGDFAAASTELGASYALEADVETLFAWAQAERKLERCDKAIELYDKLLAYDLPEENKAAVRAKLDECKAALAASAPPPAPAPAPPPSPAPIVAPAPAPVEPPAERARWKDPLGGALVGAGVIGLSVGAVFLVQASSAEADADTAATYGAYAALDDRASSRGRLGVIAAAAGGALLVGGIVRYATLGGDERAPHVTGWLGAGGGGLAAFGRF